MPVIGKKPRLTPALIMTWAKMMVRKPREKSLAKLLSVLTAIELMRDSNKRKRIISPTMPTKPNLRAKLEKAKSLYGSGTSVRWDVFLSKAIPNHWPEPNVIFDC